MEGSYIAGLNLPTISRHNPSCRYSQDAGGSRCGCTKYAQTPNNGDLEWLEAKCLCISISSNSNFNCVKMAWYLGPRVRYGCGGHLEKGGNTSYWIWALHSQGPKAKYAEHQITRSSYLWVKAQPTSYSSDILETDSQGIWDILLLVMEMRST